MRRLPLLVLLLLCLPCVSFAAPDPQKQFEAATAEFNLGHYQKAAAMYEDLYRVTLDPVLLYNIGQAHRLGGDFEKAIFFYKGYLRSQPPAKQRSEVQRRINELVEVIEAKRRGQERPPNVPANVEPHGKPPATPGPEPASPPRTTEPPPSTTTPAAEGTTPPTATEPSQAQPQPTTTASSEPSSEKPVWKKWWFWTIIGGVVVAGVVIGVAVAATSTPTFNANLPESGPGAQALTTSARPVKLLEVSF